MSKKKNKKQHSKTKSFITTFSTGCYFMQEPAWDMIYRTFPEIKSCHINFRAFKYNWTEEELLEQFLTKYSYKDVTKTGKSTFYCVFDPKSIVNGEINSYRIPDRKFVNNIITEDILEEFEDLAGLKFELDHKTNIVNGRLVVLKGCLSND